MNLIKKKVRKARKNISVGEETFNKYLYRMLRQVNQGLVQGRVYTKTKIG